MWFVVAIVTTVALLAVAIALVRQGMGIGRTARRFQEEAQPIVDEVSRGAQDASQHAANLPIPERHPE